MTVEMVDINYKEKANKYNKKQFKYKDLLNWTSTFYASCLGLLICVPSFSSLINWLHLLFGIFCFLLSWYHYLPILLSFLLSNLNSYFIVSLNTTVPPLTDISSVMAVFMPVTGKKKAWSDEKKLPSVPWLKITISIMNPHPIILTETTSLRVLNCVIM